MRENMSAYFDDTESPSYGSASLMRAEDDI